MPSSKSLIVTAQGTGSTQRMEFALDSHETVRIGRGPQAGHAIPWDRMISREHADLTWTGEELAVRVVPLARNPVLYRNEPCRELKIASGDWFQIGATTIRIEALSPNWESFDEDSTAAFRVAELVGYSASDLRQIEFQNATQQLELLAELPEAIRSSQEDEDLCKVLTRILLAALPQADAVAVAYFDRSRSPADQPHREQLPLPLQMQVELRQNYKGRFHPSRSMISQALRLGRSLLHISSGDPAGPLSGAYTLSEGLGWSFCCPVRGDASRDWCLYVSGRGSRHGSMVITDADLAPDLRFTELVGQFLGSIRQVRALQEQRTHFSTFFSPKVLASLNDPLRWQELVAPAERDVTVLFCDVRGFSRKLEQLRHELLTLLPVVSQALHVMASGIQDHDGTIADFQGDAALGFWGWPEVSSGPLPACRAALQIYQEFRDSGGNSGGPLEGFSIGIGISHGKAVAGQIGTQRQSKVGVFGPVVNLGSRLEGLSRHFGVPICIDEETAYALRSHTGGELGYLRRLARVRPKGMETAVTIYALLPNLEDFPGITPTLLKKHEAAVGLVIDGRWQLAREAFQEFPSHDGPSQCLLRLMAEYGFQAPPDWDGTFSLSLK